MTTPRSPGRTARACGNSSSCGCRGRWRFLSAFYLWRLPATSTLISQVMVPFYKHPVAHRRHRRGVGIPLTSLAIVGSSNAVNLTDGLDGLAIGCTAIVSFVFLVLDVFGRQRQGGGLFANPPRQRGGGADGVLRGHDRGQPGISVVQLPSGPGLHGRHRLAGAGGRAGDDSGADSPAAGAGDWRAGCLWRRPVRSSSREAGSNTPNSGTARAGAFS